MTRTLSHVYEGTKEVCLWLTVGTYFLSAYLERKTPEQRAGIHVELSTDNLELLYEHLKARGVVFFEPPHEESWERSMRAHDPDGYTVEFAEGRRGHRGVT